MKPEDAVQSAATIRRRMTPPHHPADADSLSGAIVVPREACRGAQTRRQSRRAVVPTEPSTEELRPWLHSPLAADPLTARGGHLPAATRAQGDDPQALGWDAELGCRLRWDRFGPPGHAQVLTPVFDPHFDLTVRAPGAGSITLSSGHASSSRMTRRGASISISTRSRSRPARRVDGQGRTTGA